jgi:hypothetical protein
MQYVYGMLAVLGFGGGVVALLYFGFTVQPLLLLIFGAVCAVAAEVSEFSKLVESAARRGTSDDAPTPLTSGEAQVTDRMMDTLIGKQRKG